MTPGQRVRLVRFEGVSAAPSDVLVHENYWRLIGSSGEVLEAANEPAAQVQGRVLVRFETNVSALGLECHNVAPNSLWIMQADLEPMLEG